MGECISDQEFKSILIMSLPDSWEAFSSSYQGSHVKRLQGLQQPQAQMSSQELSSGLIQEYYRRCKDDQSINTNTSYSAQYGGPPKKKRKFIPSSSTPKLNCKICGRQNHQTNDCRFKGKPKCSKCGKFGHQTEKCWGGKRPDTKLECTNIMH